MYIEGSYFRMADKLVLQIRDQEKNKVLQLWVYFAQMKCIFKRKKKKKTTKQNHNTLFLNVKDKVSVVHKHWDCCLE